MAANDQYAQQPPPPPYTAAPPPHIVQPTIIHTTSTGVPVVTGTFVVTTPAGPEPMIMTCPSCNHQIVTRIERTATSRTHLIACLLFCFICWPCTCLPYCMNSCNNIDHYCPNCSAYIGGYKF
ncbi:lipopolysaccharide-induced tumor necrosis factor-alpha factor homolog isoform X2 [Plodia interpunctella]|uniref:lipopolysaccharide-induced tumor necrosis factor-alpha factor homolog isoform X2 n=1 Tax=Plodia interpunctella TaxID=58824 RepID=UPI0023685A14|nr:lipopolysaccharide-induced tumor necrosis factor-alpha factor homolog isoform X2 [Plodia interpunctella]